MFSLGLVTIGSGDDVANGYPVLSLLKIDGKCGDIIKQRVGIRTMT